MDHGSMSMSMSMAMTGTASSGVVAPTSAPAVGGMGGMGGGGMGGGCKISMLWNWYTIDSCFIASSWRITSDGMFAGSCIGVILLVMSLEFLRRSVKEYDRFLIRQHVARSFENHAATVISPTRAADAESASGGSTKGVNRGSSSAAAVAACLPATAFKPNVFQQAVRALLHMLQFAVAYFVMLLAMYYNGYIIICIFIGSYLGYFVFGWETLVAGGMGRTSAANEATVCCG